MHEMLAKFNESSTHLDRNTRISELENIVKFHEAKIAKIEKAIKSIPTNFVLPAKGRKELEDKPCKVCLSGEKRDNELKIQNEKLKEKIKNVERMQHEKSQELSFMTKRIVAVYGNKALFDLMAHTDNETFSQEKGEQYMKVKPHF